MILSNPPVCGNCRPSIHFDSVMRTRSIDGQACAKNPQRMFFANVRRRSSASYGRNVVVCASGGRERSGLIVEEEELSQLEVPSLKVLPGQAQPLGVSEVERGINFAIFSQNATAVTLCLALQKRGIQNTVGQEMITLSLDPLVNKTGDIWHIVVEDLPRSNVLYVYRVDGPRDWHQGHRFDPGNILLDPYAKLIEGRRVFGDSSNRMSQFFGTYDFDSFPFDWGEKYKVPCIPENDLVIYEMNVRAFTADESSGLDPNIRGSYLGVIEKIPHLLELGINAVELLPVFEFDEMEFQRHPNPRNHLVNTWGYSTINFFSPMSRYASDGGGPLNAAREFKEMVKALHDNGIEVILDVVYNHTNEADDEHPFTTSFRGIDNKVYYMVDLNNGAQLLNFSGCGNTLNCNHPVVMELILDSLRHWVLEYHVDGFRFDLASVLCRGTDGSPLSAPPLVRVYKRKPYHSINFVTAHDGFTLCDLVSYNAKHNDANGEGGNDGSNDNFSWNCGFEGETSNSSINALRFRQMKNYHLALMVSQGTPMMRMGDEYGHPCYGNNNSYGHDTALNHFQWGQLNAKKENHFRFFSETIKFRRSHHVFTKEIFIGKNEVTWHEDNWDNDESKFLAFTLHDENEGDVYVGFNVHDYLVKVVIPPPPQRRHWYRVVDTNLESPDDIVPEGVPGITETYNMAPYSTILLEAKL